MPRIQPIAANRADSAARARPAASSWPVPIRPPLMRPPPRRRRARRTRRPPSGRRSRRRRWALPRGGRRRPASPPRAAACSSAGTSERNSELPRCPAERGGDRVVGGGLPLRPRVDRVEVARRSTASGRRRGRAGTTAPGWPRSPRRTPPACTPRPCHARSCGTTSRRSASDQLALRVAGCQIWPCNVFSGVTLTVGVHPRRAARRPARPVPASPGRPASALVCATAVGDVRVVGVGVDPRPQPRPGVVVQRHQDLVGGPVRALDVEDDGAAVNAGSRAVTYRRP